MDPTIDDDKEVRRRIRENLAVVRERMEKACGKAGRAPDEVKLLAVTKTFGVEHIKAAIGEGQSLFGENRMQEVLEKMKEKEINAPGIEWHFIGHLQRNKARQALENFKVIQSMDRMKLAFHLDRLAGELRTKARIFLQLNLAGEETKSGFSETEFPRSMEEILKLENLKVEGLMTIPPFFDSPEKARPYFRKLRELKESLGMPGIKELSMGMTGDFEVAIEEGATIVRIGTAIFGARR